MRRRSLEVPERQRAASGARVADRAVRAIASTREDAACSRRTTTLAAINSAITSASRALGEKLASASVPVESDRSRVSWTARNTSASEASLKTSVSAAPSLDRAGNIDATVFATRLSRPATTPIARASGSPTSERTDNAVMIGAYQAKYLCAPPLGISEPYTAACVASAHTAIASTWRASRWRLPAIT